MFDIFPWLTFIKSWSYLWSSVCTTSRVQSQVMARTFNLWIKSYCTLERTSNGGSCSFFVWVKLLNSMWFKWVKVIFIFVLTQKIRIEQNQSLDPVENNLQKGLQNLNSSLWWSWKCCNRYHEITNPVQIRLRMIVYLHIMWSWRWLSRLLVTEVDRGFYNIWQDIEREKKQQLIPTIFSDRPRVKVFSSRWVS